MQTTAEIMIQILSILAKTIGMVLLVMIQAVALLGSSSKAGNGRGPNYGRVRGFNQTKGHWKHEGRIGGRTHERYRHWT